MAFMWRSFKRVQSKDWLKHDSSYQMSSEAPPIIPGNSETVDEAVVDYSKDDAASWVSRHSRTLLDIGKVTVAVIIGVSIGVLFSKKK
jgi:hypothetical protein